MGVELYIPESHCRLSLEIASYSHAYQPCYARLQCFSFIEVIELARSNDIHLLCLPSHTTHILQPLDVGVFKSLKSNYSKECQRYLSTNPGRVITTDGVAGILGKAWPLSFTPVNIMAGFRKSGAFALNPGEVTDRHLAPSKGVYVREPSPLVLAVSSSANVTASLSSSLPSTSPKSFT